MIKISMNGITSKEQNPYVPVTVEEYMKDMEWFMEHGICHFHIHFRDGKGIDTLDEAMVKPQFDALKERFPGCFIGIGSPLFAGRDRRLRHEQVKNWKEFRPDYISVNVSEEGSRELSELLWERSIPIEYGIFCMEDAVMFHEEGYAKTAERVLLEISGEDAYNRAVSIYEYLHGIYPELSYLLHGEDIQTWDIIRYAKAHGLSWRIGFEDIDRDEDGRILTSNVALYKSAVKEKKF